MAKVSELIEGAFRLSNITPAGETLEAFQTAEGLRVLNQMLAAWSVDRNGVHSITKESFPITANTSTYTMGSGADFDTTRPNRITFAFIRQGGQDYPISIIDREWYAGRLNKITVTGRPWELLSEPNYPNATLTLYPVPDTGYDLFLQSVKPLAVYATAAVDLALPPEYEQCIEYNLALALANRYGQTVGQETAMIAADSLKKLKRLHTAPVRRVRTDFGVGVQGNYDIKGDYTY